MTRWLLFGAAALAAASPFVPSPAPGGGGFAPPAPRDRCPVCGMFVARTPAWVAEVVLPGGEYVAFDGPKDLFRHLLGGGARPHDSVWVTDYYRLAPVDAKGAWFVIGSDVLGPMGRELVPFAREEDALEFMRDHRGKQLLRFPDVTPSLLDGLE